MTALAWVLGLWGLLLLTGWLGFHAWLTVGEIRSRQEARRRRTQLFEESGLLGGALTEGEPTSDEEEAVREEIARKRRAAERAVRRA